MKDADMAARAIGLQIQIYNASTNREIEGVFATLAGERPDALFVGVDAFLDSRRLQLSLQAMRLAMPAAYSGREYAEVGGLMSYGSDVRDAYRQIGVYTGRILKGAKPADLPVIQASKLELVINLQTARLNKVMPRILLVIALVAGMVIPAVGQKAEIEAVNAKWIAARRQACRQVAGLPHIQQD